MPKATSIKIIILLYLSGIEKSSVYRNEKVIRLKIKIIKVRSEQMVCEFEYVVSF